jgi:hypothetical protein
MVEEKPGPRPGRESGSIRAGCFTSDTESGIDLYTPIANQLGIPVEIEVE